uniref:Uncharacterized protein n=1 Tax=Kalanchoe fedtschenkoi TaxID=63787 RepID=A0A7N0TMH5_KALFE
MDVWGWICELPSADEWPEAHSVALDLARDGAGSIELKAERTKGSNSEALVTFSIGLSGFNAHAWNSQKSIWVSDACALVERQGHLLPLVLQLVQEIVSRAPGGKDGAPLCPRAQLGRLKPDPIVWLMDSHSPESFSAFFNLVFVTRLFWLCVCDAPADVGSLYFHGVFAPNIELVSRFNQAPVLKKFLISVGVDVELCFMRTLGYMITKWLILKEISGAGSNMKKSTSTNLLGFSYANESHGFWMLKGYAPIWAMRLTSSNSIKGSNQPRFPGLFEPNEAALRYALAHQQLEALIQLEYSVAFQEGFIQVNARIDNIRLNVAKLGFTKYDNDEDYAHERHFPSRVRVWVGPEAGSSYVAGLTLGKSTHNPVTVTECRKTLKGSYGKSKAPFVKATNRTSTRVKAKAWRYDQDADGNVAVLDAVLCDGATGEEVAGWNSFERRPRCSDATTPFGRGGSLVLAGDEYGEGVAWRLGKEMEGSVLKWRIGGRVWVSYWPSEAKSGWCETRCVEWCDEVDLPLIPTKSTV